MAPHVLLSIFLLPALAAAEAPRPCASSASVEEDSAEQCQQFELTATLRGEKRAREAQRACVDFFRRAYEGRDLLCEYRVRAVSLELEANRAAQANEGGAHEALQGTAQLSAMARDVYKEYAAKMEAKIEELLAADRAYDKKLLALREAGVQCLVSERSSGPCPESSVPGVLLYGMGRASFVHSLVTFRKAAGTLQKTARALRVRAGETDAIASKLYHDSTNLSSLVSPAEEKIFSGPEEALPEVPSLLDAPTARNAKEARELLKKEGVKKTAGKEGHELTKKGDEVNSDDVAYALWKVSCRRSLPCWVAEYFYRQSDRSAKEFRNFCRQELAAKPETTSAEMHAAWKAKKP